MPINLYNHPLFSFGTLQDEDVFNIISGGVSLLSVKKEKGKIKDFLPYGVLDGLYPVLKKSRSSSTWGTVFFDLSPTVLDRLVWFEWPEFIPSSVNVIVGASVFDCTYFKPAKVPNASKHLWALESWQSNKKTIWIKHATLAMQFYGICSVTELEKHWDSIVNYLSGGNDNLPDKIKNKCKKIMEE